MAWVSSENKNTSELKPTWEYKKGMDFVTILPNTSRDFALITGDIDPTKTWVSPVEAWIHQFKVQNGFATVICDKWNEACPFCYENEIFKKNNPNYKDEKKRPPFPISSKALLQVYDFQEQRVLWLIAGQKIIEGMDFILARQANLFRGIVTITRIGEKLNTNYRVDISPRTIGAVEMAIINAQTKPMGEWRGLSHLTHEEVLAKTGVHPVAYFDRILPMKHGIDISGWGAVPVSRGGFAQASATPAQNQTPPVDMGAGVPPVLHPAITEIVAKAIHTKCTMGVYAGKELAEVFIGTGKSYIQYMAQAGTTQEEKDAAKTILDNWDVAIALADQGKGAF